MGQSETRADRHFSLRLKPFRDRIGKELLKRLAQLRTGREIAGKLQTLDLRERDIDFDDRGTAPLAIPVALLTEVIRCVDHALQCNFTRVTM
jgi:hypothetical protein